MCTYPFDCFWIGGVLEGLSDITSPCFGFLFQFFNLLAFSCLANLLPCESIFNVLQVAVQLLVEEILYQS